MNDELNNIIFICMWCQKECDVTQGTWPQQNFDGEYIMDANLNNRIAEEFVCYDCLE